MAYYPPSAGGVSDGDKGDITVSNSGATWEIDAATIGTTELSATGTPSATTYLRGDNTWTTPAGSGDVSKVGTPVDNQVGVWTGNGTIEGDTALTFDTTTDRLSVTTSGIVETGTVELGAASDTTLSRAAAGVLAVEGKTLLVATTTAGIGNTPTASGTVTITHNLGRTPTTIRIYSGGGFTSNAAATPTTYSMGIWNSSGNFCIYQGINGTTTLAAASSNTFAIYMISSAGNLISGVIQNVGATTFDIAFTETGTHTRGVYMWECQ